MSLAVVIFADSANRELDALSQVSEQTIAPDLTAVVSAASGASSRS